ncbi:MAG: MBL fold metallo-hydrolase, partial [Acidiferrobacteraceae bacterium]
MCRKKQTQWTISLALLGMTLVACGRLPSAPTPTQGTTQLPDLGEPTADMTSLDSYERFDISEDLYVRKVQSGVFIITHSFPWPGNSMIVEMKSSDLVLVDTPYTPKATREVLEWIETQLGKREITAINTGFHYDNLGGNSYLIEQGIPVYGSELTAKSLEEHGEEMRAMTLDWLQAPQYQRYYKAHEALAYVAPTHLFELEEGLQLQFG